MNSEEIIRLSREGKADELREVLRDIAYRSLYYWTKTVMGYKDLSPRLHLPGCDWIQSSALDPRKRGILWPRGHFKSTMGKGYAVWRLLPKLTHDYKGNPYPEDLLFCHDPNTRVLYISESATVAAKNLKDIKGRLEKNDMIRLLFPEIIPDGKGKWSEDEIDLPRSGSFDEASIRTLGVGGKGTGFHYDLLLYDDPIGLEAARSEPVMKEGIEWFQAAPGLMNDQETAEELILGTRWKDGAADLYGWIMENLPEQYVWEVRGCYDANGDPIFPERFTRDALDKIRKREKEYLFSCNYLNDPTAPGSTDFDAKWIRWYEVKDDQIVPEDGTPPVGITQLHRISFYDISAGGKAATAENAIVGGGMSADKRLFVLDAWAQNCTMGTAVEQLHRLNDKRHYYRNYYEQISSQKAVEDINILQQQETECLRCKAEGKEGVHHRKIRLIGEKPPGGRSPTSKEERIRTYAQKQFEDYGVYLRKGMPGHEKLKKQIIAFPHGTLLDLLDCLSYVCHLIRAPISDESEQEMREKEEAALAARENRTYAEVSYGGYV